MPRMLPLGNAEITDEFLAVLREQEIELQFERFAHADAVAVGLHVLRLAQEREQSIAASIWLGDQSVFHFALPGTVPDHDRWLARKAAVVRRYDCSSFLAAALWADAGVMPGPMIGINPMDFAFAGGGVPIRIGRTRVGVAAATGEDDFIEHDLLIEGLRAHRDGLSATA